MESLELRYISLLKAYKRLAYMSKKFLTAYESKDYDLNENEEEKEFIGYRDALIKRFEFSYDLTWKFLKQYLVERYSVEVNSPKKVFQECFQQNLITEEEVREFLKMVEARNYTSHVYDEDLIDEISIKILSYAALLDKAIKRITLNLKIS